MGWANVSGGEVYKVAASIGWNPFFQNTKKTLVIRTESIAAAPSTFTTH
jgi:hypothetical protein